MYEAGVGDVEPFCVFIKFASLYVVVIIVVINPQPVARSSPRPCSSTSALGPSRFVKCNYTPPPPP